MIKIEGNSVTGNGLIWSSWLLWYCSSSIVISFISFLLLQNQGYCGHPGIWRITQCGIRRQAYCSLTKCDMAVMVALVVFNSHLLCLFSFSKKYLWDTSCKLTPSTSPQIGMTKIMEIYKARNIYSRSLGLFRDREGGRAYVQRASPGEFRQGLRESTFLRLRRPSAHRACPPVLNGRAKRRCPPTPTARNSQFALCSAGDASGRTIFNR